MTNEMLRQMERGRVRFIATTNRADTLDAASARRFALHVEFDLLSKLQAKALFEKTFNQPAPNDLGRIAGLTPGDFAQIAKRSALLGEASVSQLATWLASAANARQGSRGKLGF